MSIKNMRLEVMQFLEKNVDTFVDNYLIPVETIWQPTDFLPNSQSENFYEEVRELREIAKDNPNPDSFISCRYISFGFLK